MRDAEGICDMIATLSPVNPVIRDYAKDAGASLSNVLAVCAKVEKPMPLLDLLEGSGAN